jgi:hypothetical protein
MIYSKLPLDIHMMLMHNTERGRSIYPMPLDIDTKREADLVKTLSLRYRSVAASVTLC